MVATVFVGSIVVRLLRALVGAGRPIRVGPAPAVGAVDCRTVSFFAPVTLLIFRFGASHLLRPALQILDLAFDSRADLLMLDGSSKPCGAVSLACSPSAMSRSIGRCLFLLAAGRPFWRLFCSGSSCLLP